MEKLTLDTHPDKTISNALTLAKLAFASYEPMIETCSAFQETCFNETELESFYDSKTDTSGFVANDDTNIVIVFRGTQPGSLPNWITDVSFKMIQTQEGWVHQGFFDSFFAVLDQIHDIIDEIQGEDSKRLWITGHSLGGALACLSLLHLNDAVAYTFGQPRVGDVEFAKNYNLPLIRFTHNRDIVPTLPSRLVPGSFFPSRLYTHVGELIHLAADGTVVPAANRMITLGASHEDMAHLLGPFSSTRMEAQAAAMFDQGITDHLIANYVQVLEIAVGVNHGTS